MTAPLGAVWALEELEGLREQAEYPARRLPCPRWWIKGGEVAPVVRSGPPSVLRVRGRERGPAWVGGWVVEQAWVAR